MKLVLKTIGFTLLMVYLAVCGFVWRSGQPGMVYRDIRVVICDSANAQFVSRHDVMQVVNSADSLRPVGKRADMFNAYGLEQALERIALIADADCYATPDSTLRIDIYQRHPILRVKSDVMRDCYVDTDGRLMAYKPCRKAIDVPLATGNIDSEMATGQLYELAAWLQHHKKWNRDIEQIHVGRDKQIRLIPQRGSHTILLGDATDMDDKFDRLETFYDEVLDEKGWNRYKTLNLKFKNQVVAEKK
ncbi:MAG: hypothetical protein E7070_02885 [Bacteroidales bacterium]|jgi:cell division protein FtsQ|nr:hypothetical protein [Bacteroidales bacterium]